MSLECDDTEVWKAEIFLEVEQLEALKIMTEKWVEEPEHPQGLKGALEELQEGLDTAVRFRPRKALYRQD